MNSECNDFEKIGTLTTTLSERFGMNFPGVMHYRGVMQLSARNPNLSGVQIQNTAISNYTLLIALTPLNCLEFISKTYNHIYSHLFELRV